MTDLAIGVATATPAAHHDPTTPLATSTSARTTSSKPCPVYLPEPRPSGLLQLQRLPSPQACVGTGWRLSAAMTVDT